MIVPGDHPPLGASGPPVLSKIEENKVERTRRRRKIRVVNNHAKIWGEGDRRNKNEHNIIFSSHLANTESPTAKRSGLLSTRHALTPAISSSRSRLRPMNTKRHSRASSAHLRAEKPPENNIPTP